MALFIAAKFSQEEMPKTFDPGPLQDLKPQEFVVVPRNGSEDIAFVASLEFKSVHQLKLRRDPYPRVLRRATVDEVESWWARKAEERRAMVLAKEKARELKLDIKISHARIDPTDNRAVFHFTSDQRVDFRMLVKELSAILKLRIELWQIGVRDEARMLDGFGVCGLQTCCSSWLKEFRPITIRMAKDQDINLPPTKLSGQCGRLLCCLSYEVDQYRQLAKEALPKGSTLDWDGKQVIIIDRNLVAGTYVVAEQGGTTHVIKLSELGEAVAHVPQQMKKFGRKAAGDAAPEAMGEALEAKGEEAPAPLEKLKTRTRGKKRKTGPDYTEVESAAPEESGEEKKKRSRGGRKRKRGRGGKDHQASASGDEPRAAKKKSSAEGGEKQTGRRKKKRRRGR